MSYCLNSNQLFEKLALFPFAICLDSQTHITQMGRFDIMSAAPEITFRISDGQGYLTQHGIDKKMAIEDALDYLISEQQKNIPNKTALTDNQMPFWGGIMGLLSYDFARSIETLPQIAQTDVEFPTVIIGLYAWAIVSDHKNKTTFFVSYLSTSKANKIYQEIQATLNLAATKYPTFSLKNKFKSNMSYEVYQQKLQKILQYIYDGECYEVNFAQRLHAQYQGSPFELYLFLKQHNPAPFGAYMHTPYGDIVSCSPEKFLHIHNNHIETKPIKGTRPRGNTVEKDALLAKELQQSEKDHAENLMIVDLMRNDLSKICQPKSIHVPKLCHLESFTNVHHLVSTIEGQLNPQTTLKDIIYATFPGGSITGAPKIRAMQIIDELEPHRRNIYCGSLFYYDIRGEMNSNILIRTLLCQQGNAYIYGGGAIVSDSNIEDEYAESLAKVMNIIQLLEQK